MQFPDTPGWSPLVEVMGGPSPVLVEGPECSSTPFLAGVCCWRWQTVPRQSWLRALGAVPRHSWLGAATAGGSERRWVLLLVWGGGPWFMYVFGV